MARMSKFVKSVLQLLCLIIISIILSHKPRIPVKKITRFRADIRHILLWTKIAGLEDEGQEMFINNKCHYINCYITNNKSLIGDLRYFDAVIFNVEDVSRRSMSLPKSRSLIQKYIFAANDSADNYPVCNPVYDNFFNWTWTYRIDSSIAFKYISTYNLNQQELVHSAQWMSLVEMKPVSAVFKSSLHTKHKAAAIFLNKCKSASNREDFIAKLQHQLSKYNLTVDVFGECGPHRCSRNNMRSCYYRLRTNYYFYLALEDSMAADFITDTVLNGYEHNTVPVVFGGAHYARFLPPNSYLDATQLSVARLAKTMHEIMNNMEWYYDFFRWRNHYQIKHSTPMNVCGLCTALNNPAWLQMNVTYTHFRKWWHNHFEMRCGIKEKYWTF